MRTMLLKKLILPLLFMAVCINANAATGNIYLAGFYQNAYYDNFAYTLINDVQTDLLPPTGGFDANPAYMAVSGGKTYVVGSYFDNEGYSRACYWVDGAVAKLDGLAGRGDDQTESVYAITVSDDKVYTAGLYMNNYNAVPCYWVDGALTTLALPAGATLGAASSIAVSGGKVYAAGYSYGSARIPGYWSDGVFVPLDIPAGATAEIQTGIAVSDKVYVMGTYKLNSKYYPCIWADGVRSELAFDVSANGGAVGKSMTVSNGKVYVSGYSVTDNRNKACYWTDGVRAELDTPADMYSDGLSIGVIDDKVYVGGRYYDSSYNFKPCYWFDGARTNLDIPTGGTQASIIGMYVSLQHAQITGNMTIGGTSVSDLTADASGTGWNWDAFSATLSLTSTYTGEAIAINCQNTDEIKLVYTGDISIISATVDAIYCEGLLTIGGSDGTLSFAYTGEDFMYSAITSMQLLTINSGDVYAECTALGNSNYNAASVYAQAGFAITGSANITTNVTSAYSHGFFTGAFNSEISTTGTVTANATGEGYAICIGNNYKLTVSNGTVNLSNNDTPGNYVYSRRQNGNFDMTGGIVRYNGGTPPTLTSLTPSSGTHNINATFSGSNLAGTTNVFVNGKTTSSFTADNDNQVTFTTPASAAGTANVVIETSGGATYLTNSFTYTNTSYRVTILSGGNLGGYPCGVLDTEAGTITKLADPAPIAYGGYIYAFTGGWYKNINCTTEWNFDTDVVSADMNIYAQFERLPVMTPADNAINVAVDETVSARFTSNITANDLSGITISPNPGNVSASIAGDILTIAHDDFEYGTEYTVTIPAGATSGNPLVNTVWKFTTVSAPVLSSDATLSSLTVSAGTLTPAFNASITEYTVTVANSVSNITINATANDGNATVTGDTGLQNLNVGSNEFTILVTAENGTTKTYKVIVTREQDTVGIEDVNSENGIQIYLNPATNHIHIKGINQPEILSVYTLSGTVVIQKRVQVEESISAGSLPDGIYLVNICGKTVKIVKK